MSNFRKYTNKLVDAMKEGTLDAETVALAALGYMSEDDVKDMCNCNDLLFEDEEEEDEEEDEEDVVYIVYNIVWDEEDAEDNVKLPVVMRIIGLPEDELADEMANITGYCVKRFECKLEEDYYEA